MFPTAVPPVDPGVEVRFRALVKQIKGSPAYNEATGAALGIEGSQQTSPDYLTLKPNIKASISGTTVNVDWDWGGYSAFLAFAKSRSIAPMAKASSRSRSTPLPATWTASHSPPRR